MLSATRRALAVPTMLLVTSLAACGTPPWRSGDQPSTVTSAGPAARATATAAPSATGRATPTASATAAPVHNDLATGSAHRVLEAGGVRLKVNYWSTLDMGDWTRSATKPLNLSASATFADGSRQNIFLSKVTVDVAVDGAKGSLEAPQPLVDSSTVSPGYLIKSPNSYGQVFSIPALAAGARSVTLTITYELLVQSAPKAKTYAKQTASNDLVVAIAA